MLDKAREADLTAVIAMDQAVIAYARQIGLEVHISTQINITNIETVKFYAMFADTMVMSRELSISQTSLARLVLLSLPCARVGWMVQG